MANKRETHHSRYSSLPNVNLASFKSILPGGTAHANHDNDDEKQTTEYPQENNADTVAELIDVPKNQVKNRRHKKSASLNMDKLANKLKFLRDDVKIRNSISASRHSYNHSENMLQNLKKYNKKDQEDLIAIQTNLRKWIGSEKYVILDQFIDLMGKIAPHVSAQQATDMFNQMDPSNNGQIATTLLLHDEFLPRMILTLFQREDSARNSITSLPDDFDIEGSDSEEDEKFDDMDDSEKINRLKSFQKQTKKLKQWIIDHGQPALEKCEELQMMLDVYEAERTDKHNELESFKSRLTRMGDLERQLNQTQSHTMLLKADNDALILSVNDSAKQHEIEHNKYNEIIREASQYKKLAEELQEINDRHTKKNQLLQDKQNKFEIENQNLRQVLLEYQTENTTLVEMMQYDQNIDEYKNEQQQQHVRFDISDDDHNDRADEIRQHRRRRMTLKNESDEMEDDDTDTFDENYTLDSELQNTGAFRGRSRRNTIRAYYEVQQRRLSHMSLPTEEQLRHDEEQLNNDTVVVNNNNDENLFRQESIKSHISAVSAYKAQNNIFENAVTEELRLELKKQIVKELNEDYELKLKQRDIELQMKLHKEASKMEEEHRKYREDTQSTIDELKGKLVEYRKDGKELVSLADNMSFDADEVVYFSSNNMSEYSDNLDDEKDVFDQNMEYDNENDVNQPLINKEKKDSDYIENVLDNDENKKKPKKKKKKKGNGHSRNPSDGKCFSCFGLFSAGSGV